MFFTPANQKTLENYTGDATLAALILWALDKTIDIWDLSYYRGNATNCNDPLDKWSGQISWDCLNSIIQKEGYAWPTHDVAQIVRAVIWYHQGNKPYETELWRVERRDGKMGYACKTCGAWFQHIGTYTHYDCVVKASAKIKIR